MKEFRIGVIRVITLTNREKLNFHGRLLEKHFTVFTTVNSCIEDQPRGIFNEETEQESLPKIISLAEDMAPEVDGIIISCAADPGVQQLRDNLRIPVTGAGAPAALYSLGFGRRIGVLGMGYELNNFRDILGEKLEFYKLLRGAGFTGELEIGKILKSARNLSDKNIDVLTLACTGMSRLEAAKEIHRATGLTVVDPLFSAGLFMYGQCTMAKK